MPILIDELEVEIVPAGIPESGPGPGAGIVPLMQDELELVSLMDLIDERRARLLVD